MLETARLIEPYTRKWESIWILVLQTTANILSEHFVGSYLKDVRDRYEAIWDAVLHSPESAAAIQELDSMMQRARPRRLSGIKRYQWFKSKLYLWIMLTVVFWFRWLDLFISREWESLSSSWNCIWMLDPSSGGKQSGSSRGGGNSFFESVKDLARFVAVIHRQWQQPRDS